MRRSAALLTLLTAAFLATSACAGSSISGPDDGQPEVVAPADAAADTNPGVVPSPGQSPIREE